MIANVRISISIRMQLWYETFSQFKDNSVCNQPHPFPLDLLSRGGKQKLFYQG